MFAGLCAGAEAAGWGRGQGPGLAGRPKARGERREGKRARLGPGMCMPLLSAAGASSNLTGFRHGSGADACPVLFGLAQPAPCLPTYAWLPVLHVQVNPADRPDIFQIISKLDLLRNVLSSEASGGSNGAGAPPDAPTVPHPHPYPAPMPVPMPGAPPPPHVLPGQQLPYPRQGSLGAPAPGPPGPMPPHPHPVHGGAPPPPGWVPPGPPGPHHPPPPYHPGQGPPGQPGPHGAPHPPAYAQPRPGAGPPPPQQQVQRQPSRGGSFNPAWPAGPPGAPGGPPGPQGVHPHPHAHGPPPPHLQPQPYPYPQHPHPQAAQAHPGAVARVPVQPQQQPDLLGDACPEPPVTARLQPER